MREWKAVIRRRWQELVVVVLIIVVAALFRFPGLAIVPPGLNFDEGGEGVAATDVWQGTYRLWWPIGGGKEPLMAYAVQPFLRIFGFTVVALRAYTATLGVIAVLGTWWLAREMFYVSSSSEQNSRLRSMLPHLAALGLATAFWHVAYSRIAFRALAMPAVEALALAWLWRAVRTSTSIEKGTRGWWHFAGAGVFIGLGAYTYLAGRFVPVALVLFFVVEAALAWLRGDRPLLVRHFWKLTLTVAVALVVFSPLAVFFARNPAAFVERAGSVSIFNPAWNQGDFWGTLFRTTLTTLGTFAALTGDPNPIGNIPGRPMLGLLLAPFFWLGVVVSLWRVGRYAVTGRYAASDVSAFLSPAGSNSHVVYLFLICWWPVMLLPGILAPEGAPHHLRILGTGPATYTLVAVGLIHFVQLLGQGLGLRSVSRQTGRWAGLAGRFSAWLILLIFLPIGLVTARDYFVRWVRQPELYMAYDVYAVELAEQMAAETDPTLAYVIPMDLRAVHEARHYTLDFLYQGDTPYYYLPVDETKVAAQLTEAAAGKTKLRLVWWTQDKHAAADEREVVAFLLATDAQLTGEERYPAYRVETWELPTANTRFALPSIDQEVDITFDNLLKLEATTISAGDKTVAVALRWAPLAATEVDYKVSLRLVTADGRVALQKDRFLRHNWHQGTSMWPRETVNEYYLLTPALPGEYEVRVVVYHPDTLVPLVANGSAEVSLGAVEVP